MVTHYTLHTIVRTGLDWFFAVQSGFSGYYLIRQLVVAAVASQKEKKTRLNQTFKHYKLCISELRIMPKRYLGVLRNFGEHASRNKAHSVHRSSPVWFLVLKIGNWQPKLVATGILKKQSKAIKNS